MPWEKMVAVGDSWFDYGKRGSGVRDILSYLQHIHHYDISRFCKAGEELLKLVYEVTYLKEALDELRKPNHRILIFSGGGNEIVGEELPLYLNPKDSGLPLLREENANYMINNVLRKGFEHVIESVDAINAIKEGEDIHIFVHGYGYPIPSGKPADFLVIKKGPWIKPAFEEMRISDEEGKQILVRLVDMFNDMLQELDNQHDIFHHIDLRPLIEPEGWANEIHPYSGVFGDIAKKFDEAIIAEGLRP